MSHPHGDSAGPTPVPAVEFTGSTPVEPSTAGFSAQATPAAAEFSAAPTLTAAAEAAPFTAVAEPAPAFQVPAVAQATIPAPAVQPLAEAMPVSAPGYAPVSAVPGYPVSAVPGYPVSATPYGYVAVAEPKKRKSTLVLSIATAVLGLAAAAMTTLFFVEHSQRSNADKVVAEQSAELKTLQDKTKSLESQLSSSKAETARANQDLIGARAKTEEVTKEREALANCFRAINAYGISPTSANRKAADTACMEAAKYY